MKRIVSFILASILFVSISLQAVFAGGVATYTVDDQKRNSSNVESGVFLSGKVDTAKLKNYLFEQLYTCRVRVDLTEFNIPSTEEYLKALGDFIYDVVIEAFHVSGLSIVHNGTIKAINVQYSMSADEYHRRYAACLEKADALLAGIKNNASLTEVQKALLIHDRIALSCEYDTINYQNNTIPNESYNFYGVLVKGVAVCQGYAEAYTFLLDRIGMKSYICESATLNHAWNIIYVDGVPYHADITWDDISSQTGWNITGDVRHNNFLLSSNALYNGVNGNQGHVANDYDTTPRDTRYDNYFWQKSTAEFCLVGDEIYYIDNDSQSLNRYTDRNSLLDLTAKWMANANSYWIGNFAKLTSVGNVLLYSLPDGIYRYNPASGTSDRLIGQNVGNYFSVYGLTYKDGYVIYDVNNSPNFTGSEMQRVRTPYNFHVGGAATCSQAAVCELCGLSYGNIAAHSYVNTVAREYLVSAGSCISPATYRQSCVWCGLASDSLTFVIENDMTNHVGNLELRGALEATESSKGYTGDTCCTACGNVVVKGRILPAVGFEPVTSDVFTVDGLSMFVPLGTTFRQIFEGTKAVGNFYISGDASSLDDPVSSGMQVVISMGEYTGFRVDIVILGDVDCNGKITAADAIAILRYAAGWYNNTDSLPICLEAGDVNGDGKANVSDAVYIMRYIARWAGYDI